MTTTRTQTSQEGPGHPSASDACGCPWCTFNRVLNIENLIGPEAAQHLRRSQMEVLLALRSALDAAIGNLETKSAPRQAEKIEVH